MPRKKKAAKKSAKKKAPAKQGKKAKKKAPAKRRKASERVGEPEDISTPAEKRKGMTVQERVTESGGVETVTPQPGDARGAQSLAYTLNPKVHKLTPKVVDHRNKPHTLRMDAGFIYHLPADLRWQGRDGNGKPGMPASIIYLGPSPVAPADLSDLHPDQVAAYRQGVVQPTLAQAEAYIAAKTSAGRAKQANLLGAKGTVQIHNAIAKNEGDPLISEPGMLPPAPAGVTSLPESVGEELVEQYSPRRRISSQERVQNAFADAMAEPFFDSVADDQADAARAASAGDEF